MIKKVTVKFFLSSLIVFVLYRTLSDCHGIEYPFPCIGCFIKKKNELT